MKVHGDIRHLEKLGLSDFVHGDIRHLEIYEQGRSPFR